MSDAKHFLWWCVGINYAVLLLWFGVFVFAHDWMYQLHARWFRVSRETFDALNWVAMAFYKVGILVLNLVPLAAIYLAFAPAR